MCFTYIDQVDTRGVYLHVSRNLFASPFELEASDLYSEFDVVYGVLRRTVQKSVRYAG